uniref:(northern house mosquito) hypothetical protein n=1 Tax=Culex pipiens TaxID=7175 RepID=A0A8D8CPJ9_CULPI
MAGCTGGACGSLISITDSKLKLKFLPDFFSLFTSFTTTSGAASTFSGLFPSDDLPLPPEASNRSLDLPFSFPSSSPLIVLKFSIDRPNFSATRSRRSNSSSPGKLPSLEDRVVLAARSRRNRSRSRFWPCRT